MMLRKYFSTLNKIISAIHEIKQNKEIIDQSKLKQYHQLYENKPIPYDKKIHRKQNSLQKNLFQHLIEKKFTSEIMYLLVENPRVPLAQQIISPIAQYFENNYKGLNFFQKCYLSYYLSIFRDIRIYSKFRQQFKQQRGNLSSIEIRQEGDLLFTYAELMNESKQFTNFLVKEEIPALVANYKSNIFQKEINEIDAYFNLEKKIIQNPQHNLKIKRSNLQLQVELILKTLQIGIKRQVLLYCFQVDFLTDSGIVIEVYGPSHFVSTNLIKGDEIVRKKILQSKGYQFIMIDHTEWSKLRGIRNQILYIQYLLNSTLSKSKKTIA